MLDNQCWHLITDPTSLYVEGFEGTLLPGLSLLVRGLSQDFPRSRGDQFYLVASYAFEGSHVSERRARNYYRVQLVSWLPSIYL
jgi:hypothetical protein